MTFFQPFSVLRRVKNINKKEKPKNRKGGGFQSAEHEKPRRTCLPAGRAGPSLLAVLSGKRPNERFDFPFPQDFPNDVGKFLDGHVASRGIKIQGEKPENPVM